MAMRLPGKSLVVAAWLIALYASSAPAQVLERGTIIDRVRTLDELADRLSARRAEV